MSHMPAVPEGPWFNDVAAFLGPAYLRNAFTNETGDYPHFALVIRLPSAF